MWMKFFSQFEEVSQIVGDRDGLEGEDKSEEQIEHGSEGETTNPNAKLNMDLKEKTTNLKAKLKTDPRMKTTNLNAKLMDECTLLFKAS